jgi:hypothetical protein
MNTTYKNRFETAYKRTQKFNLNPPKVKYSNDSFLSKEFLNKIPILIYEEFGMINEKEVFANCMGFHYKLKPFFEYQLSSDVYFTLGYVTINDERFFYLDDSIIENMLQNGLQQNPTIHAWLTLPTMEILDFTLSITYYKLKNIEEGMGRVISTHADKLKDGMAYHPVLIGDMFLRKIGGLIEL